MPGKTKAHPMQKLGVQPNQHTKGTAQVLKMPGMALSPGKKYKRPPTCPKWLTGEEAKKFWKRYAKPWSKSCRLNPETYEIFTVLAEAYGDWRGWKALKTEMAGKKPDSRGLIAKERGVVKISEFAKQEQIARDHFYRLFERFVRISGEFEEVEAAPASDYDGFYG